MHRAILAALVLILSVSACTSSATAEKRVALVVGNSAYQNVVPLPNPANDAADIAASLREKAPSTGAAGLCKNKAMVRFHLLGC